MASSASLIGDLPVLAFPAVLGGGLIVLYNAFLLVKRLVDNRRNSVEKARTDVLDKRLKKILQNLPSDETGPRKSGCFPYLEKKKRNTNAVSNTSQLSTLNESGEAEDHPHADEEVLKRKLRLSTVVKELQDVTRVLARILSGRREFSEWKVPLLKWNGRDYLLSLISPDKSSDSKHLVSVPLSISFIQKKFREGRDEEAQLAIAAQLEIDAFEGAQLAIESKAIQVVQAKIKTQWNISLQILKTTAYAIVTLLSFYYSNVSFTTPDNAIAFLAIYVLADTISNVSTRALVDFVIPQLSTEMTSLVGELELRLKRMALNKEQEVKDWLKTYFEEYNKMQELLRDDYSAYEGRSFEKAGFELVNVLSN